MDYETKSEHALEVAKVVAESGRDRAWERAKEAKTLDAVLRAHRAVAEYQDELNKIEDALWRRKRENAELLGRVRR